MPSRFQEEEEADIAFGSLTLSLGGVEFCLTPEKKNHDDAGRASVNNLISISEMRNDEILIQLNNFVGSLRVNKRGICDAGKSSEVEGEEPGGERTENEKRAAAFTGVKPRRKRRKFSSNVKCHAIHLAQKTLPEGWAPSLMLCSEFIKYWFLGDVNRNVPPLYEVKEWSQKALKPKMISFMRVVEDAAREKGGVWIEDPGGWDDASVFRMWQAIKEDFCEKWCQSNRKNVTELTWTTAQCRMQKEYSFARKRVEKRNEKKNAYDGVCAPPDDTNDGIPPNSDDSELNPSQKTLPEGWTPSFLTCSQFITHWFLGDASKNIPPLYAVKKLDIKYGKTILANMRHFMRVVEIEARKKEGVWIEDPGSWDAETVNRMWEAIKADFCKKWNQSVLKSKKELTWTTAFIRMKKEYSFNTKKSEKRNAYDGDSDENSIFSQTSQHGIVRHKSDPNIFTITATKQFQKTKVGIVFARRASISPEHTYISNILQDGIFSEHGPSLEWAEVISVNDTLVRSPRHAVELVAQAMDKVQLEVRKCEGSEGGSSEEDDVQEQQNAENLMETSVGHNHNTPASYESDDCSY